MNSNPYITPGTVSVMLGNGDGTFQPAVSYNVGNEPDAIVAVTSSMETVSRTLRSPTNSV